MSDEGAIIQQPTLRDRIAMVALSGIIAAGSTHANRLVAKEAYKLADAMMEERKHWITLDSKYGKKRS